MTGNHYYNKLKIQRWKLTEEIWDLYNSSFRSFTSNWKCIFVKFIAFMQNPFQWKWKRNLKNVNGLVYLISSFRYGRRKINYLLPIRGKWLSNGNIGCRQYLMKTHQLIFSISLYQKDETFHETQCTLKILNRSLPISVYAHHVLYFVMTLGIW